MSKHHSPPSAANVTCVLRHFLQQTAIQVLSSFGGHSVTTCVLRVSLATLPAADIAIQVLSGFVGGHSVTAQPAQHSHQM